MGLSLTLLPFDDEYADRAWAHAVLPLDLEDNVGVVDQIKKLPALPVLKSFNSHLSMDRSERDDGKFCYGNTQTDLYGEPLRYTTVGSLMTVNRPIDDARLNAAWAYLSQLPASTKVALFWK